MIDCADHCCAFVSVPFATQGVNDLIDMLKQKDQVPTKLIEAAKLQARILQPSNFVPRHARRYGDAASKSFKSLETKRTGTCTGTRSRFVSYF